MPTNFLQQLTQSGALNIPNPMASYQNALQTKALQTKMAGGELDNEGKLITITNAYIERLSNREEYSKFRDYMKGKFGDAFTGLPESFESDDEFEKWRLTATTKGAEMLKYKMGQKVKLHKNNKDGTTSEIEVTPDQFEGLKKMGLGEGWDLGSVAGTPWKPTERIAEEKKAGKKGELEAEREAGTLETPKEKSDRRVAEETKIAQVKGETDQQKLARAKAIEDHKKDGYGDPYVDPRTQSLLQKNTKTGKVVKVDEPPKGMVFESDGQGGFRLVQGTADMMSIKTKGAVEEKILAGKEQLARLESIEKEFKPEYQEIGNRLANAWTGVKATLGQKVDSKDVKKLTEFKAYQRKAIENVNLYIKEITGAQMSQLEADRIRLAQPDPGEKWYQGDDPITFRSKMKDAIKSGRAAVARYEYYKSKGLSDQEIKGIVNSDSALSLDEMVKRMK